MEPECFDGPFNPSTGPINPDLTRIWIFSQQTVQAQIPHILQVFGGNLSGNIRPFLYFQWC